MQFRKTKKNEKFENVNIVMNIHCEDGLRKLCMNINLSILFDFINSGTNQEYFV